MYYDEPAYNSTPANAPTADTNTAPDDANTTNTAGITDTAGESNAAYAHSPNVPDIPIVPDISYMHNEYQNGYNGSYHAEYPLNPEYYLNPDYITAADAPAITIDLTPVIEQTMQLMTDSIMSMAISLLPYALGVLAVYIGIPLVIKIFRAIIDDFALIGLISDNLMNNQTGGGIADWASGVDPQDASVFVSDLEDGARLQRLIGDDW